MAIVNCAAALLLCAASSVNRQSHDKKVAARYQQRGRVLITAGAYLEILRTLIARGGRYRTTSKRPLGCFVIFGWCDGSYTSDMQPFAH